jgi:hypothetical protein
MTRYLAGCLVAVLLLWSRPARAGAWTLEPGHFYLTAGYTYYFANEVVDDAGMAAPLQTIKRGAFQLIDARYTDQTLALYGEVGLWPRHFNLVFYVPVYKWVGIAGIDPDDDTSFGEEGVGDSTVALKYKIYDCKFVLASQFEVGIPSGNALKEKIPTGDNEWSYELRVMAAKDFHPVPLFFNVEVGYRLRTSGTVMVRGISTNVIDVNYSDDISLLAQLGLKLNFERFWRHSLLVLASFNGIISTRNGDQTMADLATGVSATANNQSFLAAGLGVTWNVVAGLLLSFDSRIFLWGQNTGKGYSFTGALGYAW